MLQWIDILRFANNGNLEPIHKVRKTDKEWKGVLSAEQFRITRQKGTEKADSSEMCNAFDPGKYACVCCDTDLFDSTGKFKSTSGWPSFTQPLNCLLYTSPSPRDRG